LEVIGDLSDVKLCIIGLGYVGLPLAVEFGKKLQTIGFDINKARIDDLRKGIDKTKEVSPTQFAQSSYLSFCSDPNGIKAANVYIITVPTPIDSNRKPDLRPLLAASKLVGEFMSSGSVVIFESTVYPGATEDDCVPVLEKISGLKCNVDFFVGYSPERINPGDKKHGLTKVIKVTSGSTAATANFVDSLYRSIITAGTHLAQSIKVAEAAKVIENTQRDLNIALINELAIIFNKMGIDTEEVLLAAGTKWNFLPFKPGLVGGHCIGVDPYYLTSKAESLGYNPEVILAGRRINDNMASYVTNMMVKYMLKKRIHVNGSKILIMGLTFKENCPDIRNTKVVDMISEFADYGVTVFVYDPWVDKVQAQKEYGIIPIDEPETNCYDGIIMAVAHDEFEELGIDIIRSYGKSEHVLYDLKNIFKMSEADLRL
jgi:UDP-N-acetyl-D-glucosamine/UDP-N-acetyl-D-galactosamine dehydrogenase